MKKFINKSVTNILILIALLTISIIISTLRENDILFTVLSLILIIVLFVSIIANITYYIVAKRYEKTSIKKFIEFISSLNEAIILFDTKLKNYHISNKIYELYGIDNETIINGPIYDINNIELHEAIKNKLSHNTNEIIETTILNKETNKNFYVRIESKKIKFQGTVFNCIVITDITNSFSEKKDLLNEITNMKEEVVVRNNFLSRVSHEIRTPLNGIIGMSEMAKDNLNKNDIKATNDCLNNIDNSSKYLLEVVNNILNIRSIESGNIRINIREFDLSDILNEIKSILGSQIKSKNLNFTINCNFKHLYLNFDDTKIVQIIVNIISNSIKYTNEYGNIALNVSKEDLSLNKCRLIFEIKDNGIGMSEDFAKKMFEPFAVENKVSNVPSTGLGLPIAKSLIDLLEGKVEVDSKENVGTTTKVTLVCQKADTIKIDKKEEVIYDFSNYNVLVAEDNKINQLVIKSHLESYKFHVDIAIDGIDCVNKFKNSKENYYSLILMDIHMPNMDGFEAASKIRNCNRIDNSIPVIALTADVLDKDINKALLNNMNNHISKPIIKEDMIKIINDELKK